MKDEPGGMRVWFFNRERWKLIGSAECRNMTAAMRLAESYNLAPGPLGPVAMIATSPIPDQAKDRVFLAPPTAPSPSSEE